MVEHEQLLIDALVDLVGAGNVHVFRGGSMDRLGMERQIAAFRKANIIIGMLGVWLVWLVSGCRRARCGAGQHAVCAAVCDGD